MGLYEAIKNFYIIRREIKMKTFFVNWKTSIPALIAAITNILPLFGVTIPAEIPNAINVIAITIIGLFARDADKSSEDNGIK